jgi:hypothetical protein
VQDIVASLEVLVTLALMPEMPPNKGLMLAPTPIWSKGFDPSADKGPAQTKVTVMRLE